jgi:hypothetical protein
LFPDLNISLNLRAPRVIGLKIINLCLGSKDDAFGQTALRKGDGMADGHCCDDEDKFFHMLKFKKFAVSSFQFMARRQ